MAEPAPGRTAEGLDPSPHAAVRRALPELLEPGETVRALGDVHAAHGDTGDAAESEQVRPREPAWFARAWAFATRTTPRKVVFGVLCFPVLVYVLLDSLGDALSGRWLDRLVGGRVCAGPRGSLARQAEHALSSLGPGANTLAVTDRRLVLVRHELGSDPARLTLVWARPLADVTSARPRPRGLARRRVELAFGDGSRIVLALPAFRSPRPAKVAAAFHGLPGPA